MWNDLTLSDKRRMIALAVKSGITDLDTIHEVYNKFASGGSVDKVDENKVINKVNNSNAEFTSRLKDPNRAYIDNEDGTISTHRMAYADDGRGNAIVYPEIQNVKRDKYGRYWYNGTLVNLNGRRAYESAVRNNNYVPMSTEEAEWFTQNYKDYYPGFDEYDEGGYLYKKGGSADIPKYLLKQKEAQPQQNLFTAKNLQEAIEMTPQTSTPVKPKMKQVGKDYVVNDVAARVFATENNKDNPKGGYNKKTGRWVPVESPEGGAPTIAYGIKFGTGSPEAILAERQGYLTDKQANDAVYSLSQFHINKAKEVYDGKFGEGSWDNLGPKSQSILADYSFNVGLKNFPKLMEGFHNGDIDTIRKEYKRYMGSKPLTGRNNYIARDIDSLGTFYPITLNN